MELGLGSGSLIWGDPNTARPSDEEKYVQIIEQFIAQPQSGKAFEVRRNQVLRVVLPEGPQVVDMDVFNRDNLTERFSSSRTRSHGPVHLTTGNGMYSISPWERIMFMITEDSVRHQPNPLGAVSHDLLYGRCSRKLRMERFGTDTPGCQEYIAAAIAKYGLGQGDVHDPLNIFMNTGVDEKDNLFFVDPDAVAGDYIELRAEMNCLVAVSICPGRSSGPMHHPVRFEIY